MRSHDDRRSPFSVKITAALTASAALIASGVFSSVAPARDATAVVPANGPQADYPIVVGAPYSVRGTSFIPEDVMNYDQVGYIVADPAGGNKITGSHHTLPLPSYVEVTSLETGRTVLVRLERRGPMDSTDLVALSPGALAQLGAAPGTPVRVRRVNPPEDQRAMLRAGQQAPLRMDTPMSLVDVLKRKLPGQGAAASVAQATQTPARAPQGTPTAAATPATPLRQAAAAPAPKPTPTPRATASAASTRASAVPALPPMASRDGASTPTPAATSTSTRFERAFEAPARSTARAGNLVVQAGAFSTAARAHAVARAVGGEVTQVGRLFRVRTGPFQTRREAEASLAKVRGAGYTDARIQTSG